MPIVRKYKAKIETISNPLPGIFTVTLSSDKQFKYLPGQFLHLALDDYDGAGQWPESRCFSMQSNPDEKLLTITFAVKGKFTQRMAVELKAGKEVWLKLPYGDIFQRGHEKKNCVFIAGGTGITPLLSLFTQNTFNEYESPHIYLGFRSKKYNIYKNNIREIRNKSVQIRVFYEDLDGILDRKKIFDKCGVDATYFISGPPIMIKNFKEFLISHNVTEKKIITDDWE